MPRKHSFLAPAYAVVRLEDLDEVANLRADLVAAYQPANSQELYALERLAIAQQALLRTSRMEVGMYTAFLNESLDPDGRPLRLLNGEMFQDNVEVHKAQNRNFLLWEGFSRFNKQSKDVQDFLRMQAHTERLYRRAVEDYERIRKLRNELAGDPVIEPKPEETKPPETPKTDPPETNPPTNPPDPPATTPPDANRKPVAPSRPSGNPRRPRRPSPNSSVSANRCSRADTHRPAGASCRTANPNRINGFHRPGGWQRTCRVLPGLKT